MPAELDDSEKELWHNLIAKGKREKERSLSKIFGNAESVEKVWPGRFPGIAGTHENDRKFNKCDGILNQTKRNINKLCLGKISCHKTVRIKFSVDSGFSNELYGKK